MRRLVNIPGTGLDDSVGFRVTFRPDGFWRGFHAFLDAGGRHFLTIAEDASWLTLT